MAHPTLPKYVNDPICQRNMRVSWRGCCVPLAVAMMLRADFEDVVIAMRAMKILSPSGGVMAGSSVPSFFRKVGVEVRVHDLRLDAALTGGARPTITQYFPRLNGLNRHMLTKNGHAVYADKLTRQVYDFRGVFPERRCRMNYHFELSIADCEVAKIGLTRWLEAFYTERRTTKSQQLTLLTFNQQRTVRRRRVRRW